MNEGFVSRSRYEREKAARKAAERLLEDKSRQLYHLNVELQKKSDSLTSQVQERTEELRNALEKAQAATRAKDLFLANMSHEIMTPLSGILGLTELLTEGHLSPDQQEQLINLQESCLTLKNIVDDLLDLKILEHGKVRLRNARCDCLDVINSLVAKCEPIATGEWTHITHVNSQCSSHLRMGDRTRFEQVIVNLVNNAIKFTQEGEVEIETFINDAGVTVIVSDTGIGMKSDQLERIFEDFTLADEKISTRYGGSGLGLSIVRSIMDQLGGSIVVTSEFGKGSRFTVMFPLPAATEEDLQGHSNRETSSSTLSLLGRRILLAEDSRINARVINSLVRKRDGEIVYATCGMEALSKAANEAYDLMIFDIDMPDIDGIELLQRIRSSPACAVNAKTPALACTANANAMEDQVARYIERGFSGDIQKPFKVEEFMTGIAAGLAAI